MGRIVVEALLQLLRIPQILLPLDSLYWFPNISVEGSVLKISDSCVIVGRSSDTLRVEAEISTYLLISAAYILGEPQKVQWHRRRRFL